MKSKPAAHCIQS